MLTGGWLPSCMGTAISSNNVLLAVVHGTRRLASRTQLLLGHAQSHGFISQLGWHQQHSWYHCNLHCKSGLVKQRGTELHAHMAVISHACSQMGWHLYVSWHHFYLWLESFIYLWLESSCISERG